MDLHTVAILKLHNAKEYSNLQRSAPVGGELLGVNVDSVTLHALAAAVRPEVDPVQALALLCNLAQCKRCLSLQW